MIEQKYNKGDILYVIKYHRKNGISEHYIEKVKVMHISYSYVFREKPAYYCSTNLDLPIEEHYNRLPFSIYMTRRLFRTLEEANEELKKKEFIRKYKEELKNKLKENYE